jgi:peptidoglycan/LPS O-acetylase OafA/YrhL
MAMSRSFITDETLRHSSNNLNAVRLALASAVIYSHAYYPRHDFDALKAQLGAPLSWFAVEGFFVISGFLVYRSLERGGSLTDYAVSRFTRIWPGLTVMAIVVGLAGAFFSVLHPPAYFSDPGLFRFIAGAAAIQPSYELPGVMCGDGPCNVNGSLWTIPWEVKCYIALGLIFLIGRKGHFGRVTNLALIATLTLAVLTDGPALHGALAAKIGGKIYFVDQVSRLWSAFALGIAAYRFRDRLPLSWAAAAALLLVAVLCKDMALGTHLRIVAVAYLVLCAGFKSGAVSARWPDYSFGMYIYAMPVMTGLLVAGLSLPPLLLAALVAFVTVFFAAASWHLVESPALEFRKSVKKRRAAARLGTKLTEAA